MKLFCNDEAWYAVGGFRQVAVVLLLAAMTLFAAACSVVEEAARQAAGEAVDAAVERQLHNMIAGYTDAMLYQLAYTQAFMVGGFGLHFEDFAEGEGATWRIEGVEGDEVSGYTAERALLRREGDGTSWWYLRFTPEDGETLEYEVRIAEDLTAREMYLRDPETGDIRHHEFDYDPEEQQEMDESEEGLEEAGYRTDYVYIDEWDAYRRDRMSLQVGAGTFNTDLLAYTVTDEEGTDHGEFRWWVTEDVPGHLVQFEWEDFEEGGMLRGEMIAFRQDYTSTLGAF